MGRNSNNFDLLRLLAAAQVLVTHSCSHLGVALPAWLAWIGVFPGVPIFFVISGFLVSESFERSTLSQYAINRALRIFPGLWGCLGVSILIAYVWGDVTVDAKWIAAQMTVVQFYNPDYLRDFGIGVLNGSLWTIPVELQFYIALPLIYWLLRTGRTMLLAILIGAIINTLYAQMQPSFLQKLIGETLPIYLYLFLLGVLIQQHPGFFRGWLAGRLPLWLGAYVVVAIGSEIAGLQATGNLLNPVQALFLALLVVSAAYAKAIPLRADVSYGIYLYHMPVVNALIESGHRSVLEAIGITIVLACTSWFLIERPALSLKHVLGRHRRHGLPGAGSAASRTHPTG
jgi:peptidoglycan/LPS O-acetylase OafA/YrhL